MFEVGKTYIENDPYRSPELTGVLKVEWIGSPPSGDESTYLFGFTNSALADEEWKIHLMTLNNFTESMFMDGWCEAIWDTSQVVSGWRRKTSEELNAS